MTSTVFLTIAWLAKEAFPCVHTDSQSQKLVRPTKKSLDRSARVWSLLAGPATCTSSGWEQSCCWKGRQWGEEWLLTPVTSIRVKLSPGFIFTAAPGRCLKGFIKVKGFIKDALLSFVPLKTMQSWPVTIFPPSLYPHFYSLTLFPTLHSPFPNLLHCGTSIQDCCCSEHRNHIKFKQGILKKFLAVGIAQALPSLSL